LLPQSYDNQQQGSIMTSLSPNEDDQIAQRFTKISGFSLKLAADDSFFN
jgi:hypothetical protein